MKWTIWNKTESKQDTSLDAEDKNDLSFLDSDLKRYYELVRPDIPVAFAPAAIRQAATEEKLRTQASNSQFSAYRYTESSSNESLSLDGAVRLNCRELRHRYEEMMKMGFQMRKRFQYRRQLDNCFSIQKQGMEMLGYSRIISDSRRNDIASTVQRLYDEHTEKDGILTKSGQKALKLALEDEKIKSHEKYYSVDNW